MVLPDSSESVVPESNRESLVLPEQARGKNLVELTGHAQDRMELREVSQQDVLDTLRHASISIPTQEGRIRLRWQKTPRTSIDVVFDELRDRVRVITVIKSVRNPLRRSRR